MRYFLLSLVAVGLILVTLLGFAGTLPGGDGIVAQRTLADGTELLVTQTYGAGDLGYEVGFYFRSPITKWGWCNLDHEDSQWRNGRIDYDEHSGVATIWKGSTLRGRLDVRTKKWERPDVAGWVSTAPQELREPPFKTTPSEQSSSSNGG